MVKKQILIKIKENKTITLTETKKKTKKKAKVSNNKKIFRYRLIERERFLSRLNSKRKQN